MFSIQYKDSFYSKILLLVDIIIVIRYRKNLLIIY